MHQIRVLFAYNKTQTRINNIITVTVHLISLLSIRTQAHLREGEKWLKKPNCRDMFMITKLKSKHVKGLQTLHAVLWIIDGQICRSLLKQWGVWTLWQDDRSVTWGPYFPMLRTECHVCANSAKALGEKMDLNSALATKFYSDWHLRTRSQLKLAEKESGKVTGGQACRVIGEELMYVRSLALAETSEALPFWKSASRLLRYTAGLWWTQG